MERFKRGSAIAIALLLAVPNAAFAADVATSASATDAVSDPITVTAPTSEAAAPQPPAFNGITEIWAVSENATLSDTLAGWSERAGWKLIWEPESDFRLGASGQFEGDFQDAAQRLIEAFEKARPRIHAKFYGGNSVLRVYVERSEP